MIDFTDVICLRMAVIGRSAAAVGRSVRLHACMHPAGFQQQTSLESLHEEPPPGRMSAIVEYAGSRA